MRKSINLMFLAACAVVGSAYAAVSADEAAQLNTATLTAWGAERAGNRDGTIPAYTGEGIKPLPACYNPKEPSKYCDPWTEKPLFSITAQNADRYADKLNGMRELFKKYPNYRMDIYPTHRTMVYPKYVLDNTVKNATSCKAPDGELRLEGCYAGFPFPIPKTGNQAMWNHLVRYSSYSYRNDAILTWVIPSSGEPILQDEASDIQMMFIYDPAKTTPIGPKEIYLAARLDDRGPPRRAGNKLVLLDPVDQLNVGRRVYQYIPGQRRVKLAPDLAYDTPSPFAGGGSTMDDAAVFLGALDRYDFKLVGKQEKFIMANNFKLLDYKVCPDKLVLTKHFANPDCVRWELRRVWVVEARLKPGFRHIYKKRIFYWDEDTFAAGMAENYDAAGILYRIVTAVSYPFYESSGGTGDSTIVNDLQTGLWSYQGSGGAKGAGWYPAPPQKEIFYSPEALAGEGIR